MMKLLWKLSAIELAQGYRSGAYTPAQVAQACLERLDAVNPAMNAMISRRDAEFLADAQASTLRFEQGVPLSMLDGIPLSIKDNIPMADLPTTWGTLSLKDYFPAEDEWVVSRARRAGALLIGKTNVPEFTLEGYTDNPVFGPTRNPWNLDLTPGGSSGGAVASVAAGITPLAIGTDGGGSIRRPASHAGLVGLKPSIGVIARGHMLPPLLLDFEVVGPIGRTVADVTFLFNMLCGPQSGDRTSLAAAQAMQDTSKKLPAKKRILYVEHFPDSPLDPEIASSVRASINVLKSLGHEVQAGDLPLDLSFFTQAWSDVGAIGLSSLFEQKPEWGEKASSKYLDMAARALEMPASHLLSIIEQADTLRRQAVSLFEAFDIVITPAAAALPWPATTPYPPIIDGQNVGPRGHAVYTGWVNVAGLPAIALPCQPSCKGLPIGLQMIAGYGRDLDLLDFASVFEAAQPWSDRWPEL